MILSLIAFQNRGFDLENLVSEYPPIRAQRLPAPINVHLNKHMGPKASF